VNISNFFSFIVNTLENTISSGDKLRSRFILFIFRLFKEFKSDQCFIRASSLSYTSLLALIPLTALSFSLFTAFDAFEGIKDSVQRSLVNILIPTRQDEILVYIDQFLDNSKTMGIIGLLLFAVTSIMLLNRISESFNSIWGSKNKRNFIGKFTSYTAIIVFGTLLIGTSFTITAPIKKFLDGFTEIQFLVRWFFILSPSFFIFITFLLMITAIPAGKVKLKSSLLGAFIGTIFWGLARGAFTEGASYVIRMSKLYGSLAVIPIFLFWLYLIWIIIFLALEISYVHQHKNNWIQGMYSKNPGILNDIEVKLSVFLLIANNFHTGPGFTKNEDISLKLNLSEEYITNIIKIFSKSSLIYETDEAVKKIFPSRSLNQMVLKDVIISILGNNSPLEIDTSVSKILHNFLAAGYDIIGESTVEEFLNQSQL
jgi:membrane protein